MAKPSGKYYVYAADSNVVPDTWIGRQVLTFWEAAKWACDNPGVVMERCDKNGNIARVSYYNGSLRWTDSGSYIGFCSKNLESFYSIADDLRGYSFTEAFKMMEAGQPMRQRNSKQVIVKKLEYGGKWMTKEVGQECFVACHTAVPVFSINDIVSEWVKHHEHA